MGGQSPEPLTLDAGALIAIERADRRLDVLLRRAFERGATVFIPAGVLAEVWRDGARQVRLASFLRHRSVMVEALTEAHAKAVGELCGRRGFSGIIDASVVVTARLHKAVTVSGDLEHLHHLDPSLRVCAL